MVFSYSMQIKQVKSCSLNLPWWLTSTLSQLLEEPHDYSSEGNSGYIDTFALGLPSSRHFMNIALGYFNVLFA